MGQIPSTLYGTPFTEYVSAKYDCIGSSGDSYYDKLVGGVECNPVELSKTVIIQYLLSRYNPVTGEGLDCIYNQRPFVGVDDPDYNAEDQLNDSNYLQLFTGFLNTLCKKQTTISKITIKTIPMGINPFTLASDGSVEYSTDGITYNTNDLEILGGETIYLRAPSSSCLECGKSAYDIAVDEGFVGTEAAWLATLEGPTGPAGPAGTNANIQGIVWKGTWSATPTPAYVVNDAVQYNNSSYIMKSTSGSASTNPATSVANNDGRWELLALQGMTGATGAAGSNGSNGTNGTNGTDGATGVNAVRAETGTSYTMLSSGATPGVTPGTDKGVLVTMNNASANTFTIPAALGETHYPTKFQTSVMQLGDGQTQIVAASGVTLLSANNMRYLRTKYSACTIIRITTNTYYMFGDLTNVVV